MAKYCPNCGTENVDTAMACSNCGVQFAPAAQPAPAVQPAQPAVQPVQPAVQPAVAPAPVQATPITNEGGFGTAMATPSAPAPEMQSIPQPAPILTNPTADLNQSLTAPVDNGTFAPSVPLGDQVGFVATGQPIEKKKSKK